MRLGAKSGVRLESGRVAPWSGQVKAEVKLKGLSALPHDYLKGMAYCKVKYRG